MATCCKSVWGWCSGAGGENSPIVFGKLWQCDAGQNLGFSASW
uniref:Uncharacterized protein n=1 Tax=Anguilla anguilla TaxID=7936 RepID=A0A0E9SEH3_ANGAN